jgi:hypothetical protein
MTEWILITLLALFLAVEIPLFILRWRLPRVDDALCKKWERRVREIANESRKEDKRDNA